MPHGPNDNPEKTPRVCRIRDLLGPEPIKPLFEIKDFPMSVAEILVTPDGKRVAIEGFTVARPNPPRTIKLFDSLTGEERWALSSEFVVDHHRIQSFDTSGQFLLMLDDSFSKYTFVDVGSGRPARTLGLEKAPRTLGPSAKNWVSVWFDKKRGFKRLNTLVQGSDARVILTLAGKHIVSAQMPFSSDGSRVAWGNDDGTATVLDIQQVQHRLAEVGLGW